MIFTECTACDQLLVYPYEAGEEPCGQGVFGRATCEACGTANFVERVSVGGRTYSADGLRFLAGVEDIEDRRIRTP